MVDFPEPDGPTRAVVFPSSKTQLKFLRTGYVFAFTFGWRFTLVLMGCFPVMMLLGVAVGVIFKKGISEEMRSYA